MRQGVPVGIRNIFGWNAKIYSCSYVKCNPKKVSRIEQQKKEYKEILEFKEKEKNL